VLGEEVSCSVQGEGKIRHFLYAGGKKKGGVSFLPEGGMMVRRGGALGGGCGGGAEVFSEGGGGGGYLIGERGKDLMEKWLSRMGDITGEGGSEQTFLKKKRKNRGRKRDTMDL